MACFLNFRGWTKAMKRYSRYSVYLKFPPFLLFFDDCKFKKSYKQMQCINDRKVNDMVVRHVAQSKLFFGFALDMRTVKSSTFAKALPFKQGITKYFFNFEEEYICQQYLRN